MKNTIKMSLVAAVAVAGLTTSASAVDLEQAIKGVSISGQVTAGYNVQNGWDASGAIENATAVALPGTAATKTSENEWEYDLDLSMNIPVNDMITANVAFQADHVNSITGKSAATTNNATTVSKLNFTAKTDYATFIVGKQKQPTPFLNDETGNGVVALVPAGPVTLAAGHFDGLVTNEDITAVAAIGSAAGFNASLWYLDVSSNVALATGANGYSLNVNGAVGPVNLDVTHSDVSYDYGVAADQDASLTKIVGSMKLEGVTLVAGYGFTNDDTDGRGAGVDLTGDNDAKTNFALNQLNLDALNDADAILIGASTTMDKLTLSAHYLMVNQDVAGAADVDATELQLGAAYAMSKNFTASVTYSAAEVENNAKLGENDQFELEMTYKF